jgi:hypothetical protein
MLKSSGVKKKRHEPNTKKCIKIKFHPRTGHKGPEGE